MTISGLVTLDEMKAKQEDVVKARERQLAVNQNQARLDGEEKSLKKKKKAASKQVSFMG